MNIAVITGASSGMGKEFALQLKEHYQFDQVWLIARRESLLTELSNDVGFPCRVFSLDLSKPESFDMYKNALEEAKPTITLLVNAAGFGSFGNLEDIPLSDDLSVIDVNVKALVAMTRLSLPYMKEGSKIIELCSMSSYQPVPYITTYAASKAFALSYTRSINMELKPRGIHVMGVTPYWVRTPFFDHAMGNNQTAVKNFDHIYEAKDVVKQAYKDLAKNKDVSVHGAYSRNQVRLVKLLPVKMVMNVWIKRQRKSKKGQELR